MVMVMPLSLLEKSVEKRISLEGKLSGYDEYMNMVLEETVETSADGVEGRRLGCVVLRGNNVVSISIL